MRGLAALVLLLFPSAALAAPPIVVSAAPDKVSVTFYRYGNDEPGNSFIDSDPDDPLAGFTLIDETRTIDLPPGEVTVRFEGVASGIVPQSAILFDTDLAEKNFDSRLLSQRGLIDAFTGQRVTIRRTDPKTGATTQEKGTIISRPDRLILHTTAGYEAVQCAGDINTLLFPGVPVDLTAKPTLSLTTRSDHPGGKAVLHLAYLAGNFDWQANYVGTFAPDGQSITLMGWLTLASRDRTSFKDAEVSAVAGQATRAELTDDEQEAEEEALENDPYASDNIEITAGCWPQGRTSPGSGQLFTPGSMPTIRAPIALTLDSDLGCRSEDCYEGEIVVTARRRAELYDLGDLKLYTISHPTTIGSQSMKQVRFLDDHVVKGETLYRARYWGDYFRDPELIFRFRNREQDGIGEPLPMGQVVLFQQSRAGRHLVGETNIVDKSVGEDVEFTVADSGDYDVDADEKEIDSGKGWSRQEITITNDNAYPVTFEIEFSNTGSFELSRFSRPTFRRNGKIIWRVEVPAEGEKSIQFRRDELPELEE